MSNNSLKTTKVLVSCALLTALGVVLARLIIPAPNEFTRFSVEQVPYFLAGMLFGPVPGALVGFAADFIGCLFSPYGYNPLFCLPPILYGLCAGLFQRFLAEKASAFRIALAFLPSVLLGSILFQSWALSYVYGSKTFAEFLIARGIQFGITGVIDVLIVWLLFKSRVFTAVKLWPPITLPAKKVEPNERP